MCRISLLIVAALLPIVFFAAPAVAQEGVRVYTLSDGTKVVGEVVIDGGTLIMVKDPLTGDSRTFERSLIVNVSRELADIESARPDELRFDGIRYPQKVLVTLSTDLQDDAGTPRVELFVDTGAIACHLVSGPGLLQTPPVDDDGHSFVVRLPASLISEEPLSASGEPDTSAIANALKHPAEIVERINDWRLYGLFADGIVRYLELAPRNELGAISFDTADPDGKGVWVGYLRAGWIDAPEMSEPDLWVHALDAQYAEMEHRATAASQMIRRAREIEESLASSIPVYDTRCGGDGVLSPNQRSMFTLSEEREYQDKLRRAQASVPSSGTYMYRVRIEVDCSTCTDGIKGYRRPTEAYVQAAQDHVALLRRAEHLAGELVSYVGKRRDALRTKRAESYSRDAAIAELEDGAQRLREWVSITQEIGASENRLRGIRP